MHHDQKDYFGRYLEEFREGDIYSHYPGKTIRESDNNLFSLLTMNHHPVHLDDEFCKNHQYGQVLVVGTLVFSLVVGMSVPAISGKAIANLDYESVSHDKPVFIGDTITAETEILSVKTSQSKSDRGVIYVETRAHNQRGEKVLTFRRHILIPRQEA